MSRIKEAKKGRFLAAVTGIFLSLLASYVTGFGGVILYLAVRGFGKGEPIGDLAVLVLLGLGILLISLLVWRTAVGEFKKGREFKRRLAEYEGEEDAPESNAPHERGVLIGKGLTALTVGIFGLIWMIDALDSGVPIWFAGMGMLIVIAAGAEAVYNLTEAAKAKRQAFGEEASKAELSWRTKGRMTGLMLLGVLGIYDAVSFGMAFSRGISAKALPLIVLGNAVVILAAIVRTGYEIKALYREQRKKSEEA